MSEEDPHEYPTLYYAPEDLSEDDGYDLELGIQAYNRYMQDEYDVDIDPYYGEVPDPDIVSDDEYAERMGFPKPADFPNPDCVESDIRALVGGVLMAKSDKLDTGLTSEEFDFILQEVTGKREDTRSKYIRLEDLSFFMRLTPDEIDKSIKEKGNILLNNMFSNILQFSVTDGTFRVKIEDQSALRDLYESIKSSGANRKKRHEMAEKIKNDKMENLENRRKYMISNNLLVELIARAFDKEYLQNVGYEKIRDVYRTMMTYEDGLFQKYSIPLSLEKLKKDNGVELNQQAVRDLFGRGTITKALSNPIYKNIDWSNDGKILFRKNRHKTPEEITYGKDDFDEITEAIHARNKEKKHYHRSANHQPNKEEREAMEREERKKTYEPVNLNSANIFIPGTQTKETSTFFGRRVVNDQETTIETTTNSRRYTVETVNNKDNTNNSPSSLEILLENSVTQKKMAPTQQKRTHNIFGASRGVAKDSNNAQHVSSSEKEKFLFTSDEEESKRNPKPKKEKSKKEKHAMDTQNAPNNNNTLLPRPSPGVAAWDVPVHSNDRGPFLPVSPFTSKSASQIRPSNEKPAHNFAHNTMRESPQKLRSRNPFMDRDSARPISDSQAVLPSDEYQEPAINNNSPNPQSMPERTLFINYMVTHIYLHRHAEGAPRRYWSQMQRYLEFPFNKPETLFGPHWIESLQRNPNINVIQISNGSDIFFEWVNTDYDVPSSICSRMKF